MTQTPHRILVTGATGAIGMQFLRQMKDSNRLNEVVLLVRKSKKNQRKLRDIKGLNAVFYGDLNDHEVLKQAVKGSTMVIHLAALIPTVEAENVALVTKVNVDGTQNLVNAMESEAPNALLLFSSSIAIYGDRIKTPNIQVADPLLGPEYDLYSKTKVAAEKIIQSSKLNWCIYRLSAIMGIGNHKISGIMFQVPLDTPMEITTVRDTANALVKSIEKQSEISGKIFNLGGGEKCRISYEQFMTKAFDAYGMGAVNFPDRAFARQNFHCGYYTDGDDLENILHFRTDTIETYFERFRNSIPTIQRWVTRPFAGIVKWFLTRLSKPLKAYKQGDQEMIEFYFGDTLK
ncbi:MAG: hypothetical protein Crog4KO_22140 [Crocinitomicaceae bacterium]